MAAGSKKVIIAALIGNGLIAITKFIAAGITGSSAMLSEGIHSLVDTGNQVLLLYGLKRAKRPADHRFPFGHGKEIYFWSFVVAILIFAVGAGVSLYEGVHRLLHPEPLRDVMINYIVLGLAIIFEGFAWYFAFKEFNAVRGKMGMLEAVHNGKDPTLFVVLFEDSAAMAGLLIALFSLMLGQAMGWPWMDGLAAVLIGLILAGTAIWLAIETHGLLIGEGANVETVEGIRRIAGGAPAVQRVNEVLTMHIGPEFLLVNLSIEFTDTTSAGHLEAVIRGIDRELKAAYPEIKRVFIEAEDVAEVADVAAG